MLKNYFRTAWRNLRRNKIFSAINIIGLSIGISASLVIYLIVSYDLSFDRSHRDGDRIYRVVSDFIFSGESIHNKGVTMALAPAMRKDLAGLDLIVPFFVINNAKVGADTALLKKQDHIMYADSDYFRLIAYDWLVGSPATSLSGPYHVVLTSSRAAVYFPGLSQEAIIGRRLYFDDTIGTTVTGIVRDLPYHTAFSGQVFISWGTLENTSLRTYQEEWGGTTSNSQLFVKLTSGTNAAGMENRITALYQKYNGAPQNGNKTSYRLQPLSDLHFSTTYGNFFDGDQSAHKPTLYSLLVVAALLLLLACTNFINLTTAQSAQRAKEIGIRKTIGGSRRQLVFQFLSETFLLTLAAVVLSILLSPLLLKMFADFIPRGLHFNVMDQPGILVFGVLLLAGVSLLSGLYPAMVLSSYLPVQVLKSRLPTETGSSHRARLRKTLTVGQFVVAQVFIMGTLLVGKQISYSLSKDLGFRKDAVVYFETNRNDTVRSHRSILMEKLKAIPGVAMVSLSSDIPSSNGVWSSEMKYRDGKKEFSNVVALKGGDTSYMRLYRMKLLAGRELPASDTVNALIINETYLHTLGFHDPREAIGKRIEWNDETPVPVVGVVADFYEESLHTPIKPLAICSLFSNEHTLNVALDPGSIGCKSLKAIIAAMKKATLEVYPDDSFDYQFLDETLAQFYRGEQQTALLLRWATSLMIFVSCLGLLGLVIYITNQRTKEIGIRKIVGATVRQIVMLLSSDFLKLVAWGFVIAVPLAWWLGRSWLDNFAYRTSLSWWIFLAGGVLMGGIAFLILLFRTFKVAMANPADSLRIE
ncbi:MAG: ABC transporter permease [Bacteroidota bacterium]|nr:ABC transporter permease [Bacteroidota bacterium]MDP4212339.1 ABC transporter permease [Bacteroidota bacterium]MDP4249689.1 ABC transporter permease [Bacteroidota bacterium]